MAQDQRLYNFIDGSIHILRDGAKTILENLINECNQLKCRLEMGGQVNIQEAEISRIFMSLVAYMDAILKLQQVNELNPPVVKPAPESDEPMCRSAVD